MRNTRSELQDSRYPLKLGLHAAPEWKRRVPVAVVVRPGESGPSRKDRLSPVLPGPGERVRRSEQAEAEANKLGEVVHVHSDSDN
jgi:hypothetical protein